MSIEQISTAGMQYQSPSTKTIMDNQNIGSIPMEQQNKINEQRHSGSDGDRSFTPSEKQIQEAVDSTNKEFEKLQTNLRFSVHKQTKQIMVKIIDSNTQEVIKELPPEKLLDMVASMMERAGILVDKRG